MPYVEPLSDARTKLADFFSIRLTRLLGQDIEGHLVGLAVEVKTRYMLENLECTLFLSCRS